MAKKKVPRKLQEELDEFSGLTGEKMQEAHAYLESLAGPPTAEP